MEIARTKDTGTLQYDIYLNDDQSEGIVLERYQDSEALIEHGANLGDLSAAIFATGSFSGEVLGDPNAELRAELGRWPRPNLHPLPVEVDAARRPARGQGRAVAAF